MKNTVTAQIFTSRGQQEVRASIPNSKKKLRTYTKSQFVDLSSKNSERGREPTGTGRRERERGRERVREMANSPGLFIRHITYSPNVSRYF